MERTIDIPVEYRRLFDRDWREAAVYGGRFSLKSHTVARFLLIEARSRKTRVACFREFQNSIAESSHQLLADLVAEYGLSDFQVTDKAISNRVTGSDFIFKGLHHNEQSVKSVEGIDIAWVEEAQTVSEESLEILTPTVRSEGSRIVYTYNRLTEEDPVHRRLVIEGRPNTLVLNVNYDVAIKYGWMPDSVRLEMEDDKARRPALYRAKWLGEPSALESRIYSGWQVIDEVPHEARLERRGLDFGYTNDPTAITGVYRYNGGLIFDEETYLKGLSNKQIADRILNSEKPSVLVVCDGAEPKSIDELKLYGVNAIAADKGRGSVSQGIQYIQDQKVSITRRSANGIREYHGYSWMKDRQGRTVNVPEGGADHFLDAARYAVSTLRPSPTQAVFVEEKDEMLYNDIGI